MKILLFIFLIVSAALRAAEVGSPRWIAKSFFEEESFPDTDIYYTGEMRNFLSEPNMGSRIPKEVGTNYRILEETPDRIVYSVTYSQDDHEQNWYAFIKKEGGIWKLSAVRRLALPGFFFTLLNELHAKESRSKEEEWEYQNMLLQVSSDTNLKDYLRDHKGSFRRLVSYFQSGILIEVKSPEEVKTIEDTEFPESQDAGRLVRELHLNSAGRSVSDSRVIEIRVGGILDNSVGYLFVPEGSEPPRISEKEYIFVEEIIPNWYIYKTT